MPMTITTGLRIAVNRALASTKLYNDASRKFGRLIELYRGNAPRNLGMGHLISVNPALDNVPAVTKDRRRGFLRATIEMANDAKITWENLDDPTTCAYVWGRDINEDGRTLHRDNLTLFSTPSADFWKCTYLKHRLGNTAFRVLWSIRDTSAPTVYDSLLYAVNNRTKSLAGWPIIKLKNTVFVECAFVFEIAKRGGAIATTGFGLQPVLYRDAMQQVYD